MPSNAFGNCQIGALGLYSGTLGIHPIFVFGSGIVTLPTIPSGAAPPASPGRTPKFGGEIDTHSGGLALVTGGIGLLTMLVVAWRRRDTPDA
jgi:hypothetical protein